MKYRNQRFKAMAFVLALGMVLGIPQQVGASTSLERQDAAAGSICPGGHFIDAPSVGHVNGDGLKDLAGLIACEDTEMQHLAVFLGSASSGFEPLASTSLEPHERRWDGIKIERGTVLVEQGCAAACNANWQRAFRFRYRAGKLLLIRETHQQFMIAPDLKDGEQVRYDTSSGSQIDFLKGTARHWRVVLSAHKRVERTLHFPTGQPESLQNFDFERVLPGVHGRVDESFKLHVSRMVGTRASATGRLRRN